jgi:hypothetical protein
MGYEISGYEVTGYEIRGSDFLNPMQLSIGCDFWLQWKTGITVDGSDNVQEWLDQSGNLRHFEQTTPSRRPAYNASTGQVTPDGIADFLRNGNPVDRSIQELTCVVQVPATPSGVIFGFDLGATIDSEALNMQLNASRTLTKFKLVSSNQEVTSSTIASPTKLVVSFNTNRAFINGEEVSYDVKKNGNFLGDIGYTRTRLLFFASPRNSGGIETTPTQFCNVPIFEACLHQNALSDAERIKLINYFRITHQNI